MKREMAKGRWDVMTDKGGGGEIQFICLTPSMGPFTINGTRAWLPEPAADMGLDLNGKHLDQPMIQSQ